MFQIESIPAYLREYGRFVLHKDKVPLDRNGRPTDPTDADNALSAAEALAIYQEAPEGRFDGIGVIIAPPLVGIDLDHAIDENRAMSPLAEELLRQVDTYAELSPSGTGLHLIGLAPGLAESCGEYRKKNSDLGLEIYFEKRYFRFSGDAISPVDIQDVHDSLQWLLNTYMKGKKISTERGEGVATEPVLDTRTDQEVAMDAAAVMSRMRRGADWDTVSRLLAGEDIKGNTSDDDMSLLNRLAFYSIRDARVMDHIYRTSKRYRDKWDERRGDSTWGAQQIAKAIRDCRITWSSEYRSYTAIPETETDGMPTVGMRQWLDNHDILRNGRYTLDDRGGGYLLADCLRETVRYVPESRSWYIYRDGVWSKDDGGTSIAEYARRFSKALANYASDIEDEGQRAAWMKFAGRWCQFGARQTYIREAESVWPIPITVFDRNKMLLNCQNGTLDLESMDFHEHRADDLLTRKAAVNYQPDVRCERWERFIEEVIVGDTKTRRFLQAWVGYCLTGITTEECAVILYGRSSRNGKSSLCETIAAMLGSYAANANPSTLAEGRTGNGSGPSADVARLRGIRWVQVPEPPQQMVLDAAKLKTMTGGDKITARFLHENDFEFKPEFKLTINTNYLPRIDDLTLFKSDRIHVIPFERHFSKEERDPKLKAALSTPEALSGILNWALEGLRDFKENGLQESAKMDKALQEYKRTSDKLGRFIEECLPEHADPGHKIRAASVYTDYTSWCRSNGVCAESQSRWREGLKDRGIEVKRGRPSDGGNPTDVIVGRDHWLSGFADCAS